MFISNQFQPDDGSDGVFRFIGFILSVVLLPPARRESIDIKKSVKRSFSALVRDANIAGLFIIRFSYMLCVGSIWAFLPLIADTRYGMSSSAIGVLMSLLVFSSAALSLPIGTLADKINKRALLFLGGILSLVGIWFLIFASDTHDLIIVVAFFGLGGGILTTVSTAMSAVMGKSLDSVGSVMSLLMAGHSAGMFTGPLLSGFIMDHTGSMDMAFKISGVVLLLFLSVSWFLTRHYYSVEASTRQ